MNAPVKANTPAAIAAASPASSSTAEEDDEIQLAMEMALAAAQNPHLSPAEIRKLVGQKNEQAVIVAQYQQQKEEKKLKDKEEAARKWVEQKEKAFTWWSGKAAAVKNRAADLREAAAQKAEELKYRAECQLYAEEIRQDREIIETRKKMKLLRKTIKAHRLHGNRAETRHMFKRQRMEKQLMHLNEKVKKTQLVMTNSSYNVHEYAKAMLRASRKWKKRCSDEELTLEAQLCRNMHQMLALEKQKTLLKKSSREIKKYMQRCKGWLSDKQAFYEMNMITLDATASSMKLIYEDMVLKQDKLIMKLIESGEFEGIDVTQLEVPHLNFSDAPLSPGATLCALRGLPISDSIRLKKEELAQVEADLQAERSNHEKPHIVFQNGRPELLIETKDDVSVSSHMTDPEEFAIMKKNQDSDSDFDFGNDAPWMASESDLGVVHEGPEKGAAEFETTESTDTSNNMFPTPLGLARGTNGDHVQQPSPRSNNTRAESKNTYQGKELIKKETMIEQTSVSPKRYEKPNGVANHAKKGEEESDRRRKTIQDAASDDIPVNVAERHVVETPPKGDVAETITPRPLVEEKVADESGLMVDETAQVKKQEEEDAQQDDSSRKEQDSHGWDHKQDGEALHDDVVASFTDEEEGQREEEDEEEEEQDEEQDGSDHAMEQEEEGEEVETERESAPIQWEQSQEQQERSKCDAHEKDILCSSSSRAGADGLTDHPISSGSSGTAIVMVDSVPVSDLMANTTASLSSSPWAAKTCTGMMNMQSDGMSESNNSALVGAFIESPTPEEQQQQQQQQHHKDKMESMSTAFDEPVPFQAEQDDDNDHFMDSIDHADSAEGGDTAEKQNEAMNYSWNSGAFSSSEEEEDDAADDDDDENEDQEDEEEEED